MVALGEVLLSADTGFASGAQDPHGVWQIRMHNVARGGGLSLDKMRRVPATAHTSMSRYLVERGDILFNLTNSPELAGKSLLVGDFPEPAVYSNHFARLCVNTEVAEPGYVWRWLQAKSARGDFRPLMRQWVGQATVDRQRLLALPMEVPELSEQRRIAASLDQADEVRRVTSKRARLLNEALVFQFKKVTDEVEMRSIRGAELMPFMRNGVSPSSRGTSTAEVLTLSAVTAGTFEARHRKVGAFDAPPSSDKRVSKSDMLMSRGNGNPRLVGVGVVPDADMPELVFPDTVIAGRINTDLVEPAYLEMAWRQPAVRRQIEASARTTNGTHKVNQLSLGSVLVDIPSMIVQKRFTSFVSEFHAERLRSVQESTNLEALFASLQSRAFRGEL